MSNIAVTETSYGGARYRLSGFEHTLLLTSSNAALESIQAILNSKVVPVSMETSNLILNLSHLHVLSRMTSTEKVCQIS